MSRRNLLSLFDDFSRFASDVAIVQHHGYRRESVTYGQLAALARFCAQQLQQRGVRTNDRVLLWGPNSCLLYTSPSPRDRQKSRMPSSA